ncbi:MAG: hypothetical protein PUP92_20290 [Rhizonema sp. PD38]|nr:hypothetical protein [Rhizonema sp. PD38]
MAEGKLNLPYCPLPFVGEAITFHKFVVVYMLPTGILDTLSIPLVENNP